MATTGELSYSYAYQFIDKDTGGIVPGTATSNKTYFTIPIGPFSCYSQSGNTRRCEEYPTILDDKQVVFDGDSGDKITAYTYSFLSSNLPVYPVIDLTNQYQYYTYITGYFSYFKNSIITIGNYSNIHAYAYTDYKGVVCSKEGSYNVNAIGVTVTGKYSNLSLSGFTTRYSATVNWPSNIYASKLTVYFTANYMGKNMNGYSDFTYSEKKYVYITQEDDGVNTSINNISSSWSGTESDMISGAPSISMALCGMDSHKPDRVSIRFAGLISKAD